MTLQERVFGRFQGCSATKEKRKSVSSTVPESIYEKLIEAVKERQLPPPKGGGLPSAELTTRASGVID